MPTSVQDWFRHWSPRLLTVATTAVLAIAAASPQAQLHIDKNSYSWRTILIVVAVLLALAATYMQGRREGRLTELEHELEVYRSSATAGARTVVRLIRAELDGLRDQAGHFSNERVSLFRGDEQHFVLVGRLSRGPIYDRSPGRGRYPLREGLLGRAWQAGSAYEPGLPNPGLAKPWNRQWCTAQRDYGVPTEVAAAFTMPTRLYVAQRIDSNGPVGVVVFESVYTAHEVDELPEPAQKPLVKPEELDPFVLEASPRLARLLVYSRGIADALIAQEIREATVAD